MSLRSARRQAMAAAALLCGVTLQPSWAVMAGAAPDSPAARVDANAATSLWRGVVSVQTPAGVFSGVAVGRRHVLTAAHVLDTSPAPADVVVFFNASPVAVAVGAARYTRHPAYVGFGVPTLANDLALIELVADRPSASTSYAIATLPPIAGTTVTVVGYGASGHGDIGVSVARSTSVKRIGANALDVLAADAEGVIRLFQWDFDGPTAATNFRGGPTLGNGVETTLAAGDSGAGVFQIVSGVPVLAGLASFSGAFAGGPSGQGVFGTAGGGQVLAGYATWIRDVIAASGHADPVEDVPLPGWAVLALAVAMAGRLTWRRRVASG
jgi:secreted trypsin-like serine protease